VELKVHAISQIDMACEAPADRIEEVLSLLEKIGRSLPRSPTPAALTAWQARQVVDYIDRNITEPLRVSNLCAVVHRTESHFSRIFKRTFGVSPHAYIVNRRLELALRLIAESSLPLSQIALKCGFGDQAHLSNRFRQRSGMTPSAWRRAVLSRPSLRWGERATE
jgi:AraC-like DNA-binding protein